MDCFNHSCSFRVNETSNANRCECVACQNRNNGDFIITSNRTLTDDEMEMLTALKCYGFYADHLISNGVTVQELYGCKYCKEYEDLPEHFIDSKAVGRVFDTCIQPNENGLWHLEVSCGADIGIRFCPMCGRELPQPPKGE